MSQCGRPAALADRTAGVQSRDGLFELDQSRERKGREGSNVTGGRDVGRAHPGSGPGRPAGRASRALGTGTRLLAIACLCWGARLIAPEGGRCRRAGACHWLGSTSCCRRSICRRAREGGRHGCRRRCRAVIRSLPVSCCGGPGERTVRERVARKMPSIAKALQGNDEGGRGVVAGRQACRVSGRTDVAGFNPVTPLG